MLGVYAVWPLLAFVVGSLPFGLWLGRWRGIDVRQHGSRNIGATNVWRTLGWQAGLCCFVLDLLKGMLPVAIVMALVQIEGRSGGLLAGVFAEQAIQLPAGERLKVQLLHVLTALAAILGHNYSPWLGFRGGKGVATSAGVILALMPFGFALLLGIFVAVLLLCRYVSVASMAAALSLPVLTHLGAHFHREPSGQSLWQAGTWNKPLFAFSVLACAMVIWKHRANISRLLQGQEPRIGRRALPDAVTPEQLVEPSERRE